MSWRDNPKEWWDKHVALEYFNTEIVDLEDLLRKFKEEHGTHASVNVFNHFLEVLKEKGTDNEYSFVIGRLGLFLGVWFDERIGLWQAIDTEERKEELIQFLSWCRKWRFYSITRLQRLKGLIYRDAFDLMDIYEEALEISKGNLPPIG